MRVARFLPPPGLWLAGAALYLALTVDTWTTPPLILTSLPDAASVSPARASVLTVPPPHAPADVTGISARPLFSETRRPIQPYQAPIAEPEPEQAPAAVAPPEPAAPLPPTPPEGLILLGTMHSGEWRALLRGPRDTPERWMSLGSEIEGWQLRDIDETSVTFGSGDAVFSVRILR